MVLAAFLSPDAPLDLHLAEDTDQITASNSPLWPAQPATFEWEGREYDVYQVPIDGTTQDLALVDKGRQASGFVDPANPDAGVIVWEGSWRALEQAWTFAPHWQNYPEAWEIMDFPRLVFNTAMLAIDRHRRHAALCVLVAYGFSRFRFPGRNILFLLLLSTIFLPAP